MKKIFFALAAIAYLALHTYAQITGGGGNGTGGGATGATGPVGPSGAFGGVVAFVGASKTASTADSLTWVAMTTANATLTLPNTPPSATFSMEIQNGAATGNTSVTPGTALIFDSLFPAGSTTTRTISPGQARVIATDGVNYYMTEPGANGSNGATGATGATGPSGPAGGGTSTHLAQYFFAEDPSTGTYIPNGLDMRACTGCVQATGSSDFAHFDLPSTGTPAMTLSYNMASTQTGNLVLDFRSYNNQGGSGIFLWNVDHYCATPGTGSVGTITYGNSQVFSITATGSNTLKSTTLNVDLTSCSPGDSIFIRLTRDASSTYPNTYGFIGLIIRETY